MGGEGSKKSKVLKRKGREVEEALLFEDRMDEATLEQWERKMGLRQEEASSPASDLEEPGSSSEALQEIRLETEGQREQAQAVVSPEKGPSWRQSGKLRWLGLAGVRLYLEEKRLLGKSWFLAGTACVAACLSLITLLWISHKPEPSHETPRVEEFPKVILELIVPLEQGKAGLLLCLSLELERAELQTHEVRKELFELIAEMDPAELLGDQGMRRLKASVAERLSSKWPWVKREGIRFLEYLIL